MGLFIVGCTGGGGGGADEEDEDPLVLIGGVVCSVVGLLARVDDFVVFVDVSFLLGCGFCIVIVISKRQNRLEKGEREREGDWEHVCVYVHMQTQIDDTKHFL